jgi:hypothetical protein
LLVGLVGCLVGWLVWLVNRLIRACSYKHTCMYVYISSLWFVLLCEQNA